MVSLLLIPSPSTIIVQLLSFSLKFPFNVIFGKKLLAVKVTGFFFINEGSGLLTEHYIPMEGSKKE